jgi:hypothetical protein
MPTTLYGKMLEVFEVEALLTALALSSFHGITLN